MRTGEGIRLFEPLCNGTRPFDAVAIASCQTGVSLDLRFKTVHRKLFNPRPLSGSNLVHPQKIKTAPKKGGEGICQSAGARLLPHVIRNRPCGRLSRGHEVSLLTTPLLGFKPHSPTKNKDCPFRTVFYFFGAGEGI